MNDRHRATVIVVASALAMASAATVGAAGATEQAPLPVWAVDPAAPGSDRPAAGVSLFDEITADGVPFPFEALVRKIERATGCMPGRCTSTVLIPLGRSLQRTAAAPEFFRYPRAVLAVTAEGTGPLQARDRLYLGYQERAEAIEVISYNETAGRFEFQLVRDYRADGAREVVAAGRTMCVSCHQNQAPIFPRQQWDETNANPHIAAAIIASQPAGSTSLHGVAIRRGVDLPNAIDDATDRANLIGVIQRIWRDACDAACRSAAVTAALQYRLSQEQGFSARTNLVAGFARAWPAGLAIPNPDLPNRTPLELALDHSPARQVDLPAAFDALRPRAPAAWWSADDGLLEARFVAGLAAMIPDSDLRAIEAALQKRTVAAPRKTLNAQCTVAGEQYRCDGDFAMTATATRVERLRVRGGELTDLSWRNGRVDRRGGVARTTAGDRIERLTLQRSARGTSATLSLVEDLSMQRAALNAAAWPDVYSRATLRSALRLPPLRRCCSQPRLQPAAGDRDELPGAALPFAAACGNCHRGAESAPPNFLAGSPERVNLSLRHCAPRMYVRLASWQVAPGTRAKVPMPPPRASDNARPHVQAAADADVAPLQSIVATWLRAETGAEPSVDALLARGYESLRPCLPPAT